MDQFKVNPRYNEPKIKFARPDLIKPLTHLVNTSLITEIFPEQFKISKIKPFYKPVWECVWDFLQAYPFLKTQVSQVELVSASAHPRSAVRSLLSEVRVDLPIVARLPETLTHSVGSQPNYPLALQLSLSHWTDRLTAPPGQNIDIISAQRKH